MVPPVCVQLPFTNGFKPRVNTPSSSHLQTDVTFDPSHMQTGVSVEVRNASRSPEVHDTSDKVLEVHDADMPI